MHLVALHALFDTQFPVTHTRDGFTQHDIAHNGLIPPLCATPCFLIPSLVCDTKKNARPGR